jgi:hypothetical protein
MLRTMREGRGPPRGVNPPAGAVTMVFVPTPPSNEVPANVAAPPKEAWLGRLATIQYVVAHCDYCCGDWLIVADHLPGSDAATCPDCQPDRDVEMPLWFRPATELEITILDHSKNVQRMIIAGQGELSRDDWIQAFDKQCVTMFDEQRDALERGDA